MKVTTKSAQAREALKTREDTMELQGQSIAILVENLYEDPEFWYPLYRFREAGAQVTVVGTGKPIYNSKKGYEARADKSIDDVTSDDFDAVIIPGGYAPDYMRRNERMVNLVRDLAQEGKVVAAICHAGWMLCSAGVIQGKRVTSYFSIKDDMTSAGGLWEDSEVVRDGNIITSRMPNDLPAFCRTVIAAMVE